MCSNWGKAKAVREFLGLSRKETARALGITPARLMKIEKGKGTASEERLIMDAMIRPAVTEVLLSALPRKPKSQ